MDDFTAAITGRVIAADEDRTTPGVIYVLRVRLDPQAADEIRQIVREELAAALAAARS